MLYTEKWVSPKRRRKGRKEDGRGKGGEEGGRKEEEEKGIGGGMDFLFPQSHIRRDNGSCGFHPPRALMVLY